MTVSIVLTGLSGSGKTSVGQALAERLGCTFVDTDSLIEADFGSPIAEIFSDKGEPFFRDLETKVLEKLASEASETTGKERDSVVSTGGGAVISAHNRRLLRQLGKVVYLTAPVKVLAARLSGDMTRPLLNSNDRQLSNDDRSTEMANLILKLENLLNARKDAYMEADLTVETEAEAAHDIADKILSLLNLETNRL